MGFYSFYTKNFNAFTTKGIYVFNRVKNPTIQTTAASGQIPMIRS